MNLPSWISPQHGVIVKSCSVSILRFNFTLRFECKRECLREIYVYLYVHMLEKSKKWIYSVSGSNISIHNRIEYFSRHIACKRIIRHEENGVRLYFEIPNVFVTDHEDTRDDNVKMHERIFSRRISTFLTREAQFVARFTQITARILPCNIRDRAPKSIYSISKMYNGYLSILSLSLSLCVSISI